MSSNKRKRTSDHDSGCDKPKRQKRTKCNYCFKERELVEGKPYCSVCARDAVECRVCIRPLREDLVVNGVCRACRKKEQPNFRTGLGGAAETEDIEVSNRDDALESMAGAREHVRASLGQRLGELFGIKWFVTLVVTLYKYDKEGERITYSPSFRGEVDNLLIMDDVDQQYNNQVIIILILLLRCCLSLLAVEYIAAKQES